MRGSGGRLWEEFGEEGIVGGIWGRFGEGFVGIYYDLLLKIMGKKFWGGFEEYLLQGASSAGPGARLCRAPTPAGGVIEIF